MARGASGTSQRYASQWKAHSGSAPCRRRPETMNTSMVSQLSRSARIHGWEIKEFAGLVQLEIDVVQRATREHRPALMMEGINSIDLKGHFQRPALNHVAAAGADHDPDPVTRLDEAVVHREDSRPTLGREGDPSDLVGVQQHEALVIGQLVQPGLGHRTSVRRRLGNATGWRR